MHPSETQQRRFPTLLNFGLIFLCRSADGIDFVFILPHMRLRRFRMYVVLLINFFGDISYFDGADADGFE